MNGYSWRILPILFFWSFQTIAMEDLDLSERMRDSNDSEHNSEELVQKCVALGLCQEEDRSDFRTALGNKKWKKIGIFS